MRNTRLPGRPQFTQHQLQLSRRKLYAAMLMASQGLVAGQVWAAPEGGVVVGGEGIVQQVGVETIINQATERMAIDWRSFDVAANERVEFIQPSSSSIALNRVLSNRGSEILGRIDANGQVMLVNPNGVVFGKNSIVNVGGMIASGLNIEPTSFINGDFALNSIEGAEGKVINYGIINAATGGSVTLVGEQVQNDGLIFAKLGTVNLVAGNAAVLTFDPSGMVGVRVSEAVVQDELGVDAAVINNGSINAEGGRVLLSASVSEDVFSNAVNNAGMNKESSVVMHDDGSFTLGAGADVVNTGDISVSTTNGNAGQIVALGDNIIHSGAISANTSTGTGGSIELHSTDTTLLAENSTVSARAIAQGEGGDVKVLGNKVGLFDQAEVNASGANGGGQVLIGGDKTGDNKKIRNSDFIYLSEDSSVKTDALINGDGGKLITFASDTARIYGNLYSRGGSEGGSGGFIETSGLKGFEILNTPDITAAAGTGGTWLVDPYSIVISGRSSTQINTNGTPFTSTGTAILRNETLTGALTNGSTVIVQTGGAAGDTYGDGDITVSDRIRFNISNGSGGDGSATLRLLAHNSINVNAAIERDNDTRTDNNDNNTGRGILNLELIANKDNRGGTNGNTLNGADGGSITIANNVTVATNGGYFYAGKSAQEDVNARLGNDYTNKIFDFTSSGTISTYGRSGGGDIVINATNSVSLGALAFGYDYLQANSYNNDSITNALVRVGSVIVNSGGDVELNGAINFNNTSGRQGGGGNGFAASPAPAGEETFLNIDAFGDITINALISDAGYADSRDALNIKLNADKDNNSSIASERGKITINADIYTAGGNFTASGYQFTSSGKIINTDRANALKTESDATTEIVNGLERGVGGGNATWSNGGNVTISASDTITLGSITTDGSCVGPAVCTGDLMLSGIDADTNAAGIQSTVTITQAEASVLTVAGETTLDVGSGSVTLPGNNSFNKKINVTSVKDITLTDVDDNGLTLSDIKTNGGKVDLTSASSIVVESIDTSATTAGNITLKANGADFVKSITVNGDLKAQGNSGQGLVELILENTTTEKSGLISFGAAALSSNITVKGSGAADSLTALNADNTWTFTTASRGAIAKTGSQNSKVINFEGFENLAGGSSVDKFDISQNISGVVNGGDGADIFDINSTVVDATLNGGVGDDVFNINVATTKATLKGDAGDDTFNIEASGAVVATLTGGDGAGDKVNIIDTASAYSVVITDESNAGSISIGSIETVVGNNHIDTSLQTLSGTNAWRIYDFDAAGTMSDGANDGTVAGVQFVNFEKLIGGTGSDSFEFGPNGRITGSINGGGGVNSITARIEDSTWLIDGEYSGSLAVTNGITYLEQFDLIQSLVGTTAKDTFSFAVGAKVSSASGNGGTDTADLSQIIDDITVTLGSTTEYGFTDVDRIIGNSAANFTLAANGTNTWDIYDVDSNAATTHDGKVAGMEFIGFKNLAGGIGANAGADTFNINNSFNGTISGGDGADIFNIDAAVTNINGDAGADTFTIKAAVTNLQGGAGNDSFIFYATGSATTANGGSGADIDSVDLRNLSSAHNIILDGNTIHGVSNIERVIASAANNNTLTAYGANTWDIYDVDGNAATTHDGKVAGMEFVGFKNLAGGIGANAGADTFNINNNFEGTISGGAGADIFNINALVSNILGGADNDSFVFFNAGSVTSADGEGGANVVDLRNITSDRVVNLNGSEINGVASITRVIANGDYNFTLAASSGANTWRIYDFDAGSVADGINDGTVAGIQFVDFKTLSGGADVDIFDIETNFNGTISGSAGADIFNIKSLVNNISGGDGDDSFVFFNTGNVTSATGNAGVDIVDLRNINADRTISLNGSSINGVASVATVIANSDYSFTLEANSGANTWHVFDFDTAGIISDGINDGTVAGINFVDFKNLTGGSGVDTFNIDTDFTGTISGGAGADIFNISAAVSTILGGADNDSFVFFNTGSVASADGEGGANVVDLHNITADGVVNLNGNEINGVANIARVIANSTYNFTLAASSGSNTWRIYDFDAGSVADGINDGTVAGIQFVDFKNLIGGSGADTFDIEANFAGTISGGAGADVFNIKALAANISGGDGDDSFVFFNSGSVTTATGNAGDNIVDLRNINANRTITLNGSSINDVASIATVIANNAYNFTLFASSGANTWHVYDFDTTGGISDGINDGTVAGINFVDFKSLSGGAGVDIFNIDTNFNGTISGGAGEDIFNINAQVSTISGGADNDNFVFFNAGNVASANGDAGDDIVDLRNIAEDRTINLNGTRINGVDSVVTVIANNSYNFTLAANSGSNNWRIYDFDGVGILANGINDGTVAGINFVDFKTLAGGTGADIFDIDTSFTGTISGGAGADIFNIRAQAGNILGGADADIFNVDAATTSLLGEGGNDSFFFNSVSNAGSAVTIDGGSANENNSLTGRDESNVWNITAENTGSLGLSSSPSPYVNGFSNIQTLNGGAGADNFVINAAVNNAINAGAGSSSFTINAAVGDITGGDNNDTFIFGALGTANTLNGGGGANTLIGRNLNNTWDITSTDEGRLSITNGATYVNLFRNIQTLQGGTAVDTFNINNIFSGVINGGLGADIFSVSAIARQLNGNDGDDVFAIESSGTVSISLDGGAGENRLNGRNANNTWAVSGLNSGSLGITNGTNYVVAFSNIQNLYGGTSVDIFELNGTISTSTHGGAGNDQFIVNAVAGALFGDADNDQFLFNSVNNAGTASEINGGAGDNEITGRNAANTWSITAANAGNVVVAGASEPAYIAAFTNIQTLNGGEAADIFEIGATINGALNAGNGNNIFRINTSVNSLLGGAGDDQFIFGSAGSAQLINGAGGNNSLAARNEENIWNINAANAGNIQINHTSYVDSFLNIQNLQGGASIDTFNINAAVGSVFGNAGNDRFSFNSNNNGGSAISIDGGVGSNTLSGRNAGNIWTMLAANSGRLSSAIGNVYVDGFSSVQNLEGGNSSDTLYGVNQNNDWNITSNNSGNLRATGATASAQVAFTNIENLVGALGLDTFIFTNNQSYITGLVDGGISANVDKVDLSAMTAGMVVELGSALSDALNLVNIESIAANSTTSSSNVLIGASDIAYRWSISTANSGLIQAADPEINDTGVSFTNFGELRGGTNNDRFNVQASVSNSISGGDGDGTDLVDYSSRNESFTITLGGNGSLGSTGINGIEGIIGNSGGATNGYSSTINVTDGDNIWTIGAFDLVTDGLNDGTVKVGNKTVSFENFNQLIGGTGNDLFNYSAQGQLIGLIDGGAGNNRVDSSLSTKVQEFHAGGNATGITKLVRVAGLTGNTATNSSLVNTVSTNTWNVNSQGLGNLNSVIEFSGISNLKGGAFVDVFNLADISGFTGIIDGGSAVDEINLLQLATDASVGLGITAVADLKIINIESINANPAKTNTLVADNLIDNIWTISGANAGSLNTSISFTGFSNLVGRETSDAFNFVNELASISGWIDAGAGADRLNLTNSNRNMVVRVTDDNGAINSGEVTAKNFESIDADADNDNKLIAKNTNNIWAITSTNSGTLQDTATSDSINFTNFNNISGGNQDDIFNFGALGLISGSVDGAGQLERDVVDISHATNANIIITAGSGYKNIEKYIGNNTTSTLTADNVVNNWTVTNNGGILNSNIEFEQFANLVGGNGQDIFSLNNSTLSGYIDGAGGNDTFNLVGSVATGDIRGGMGDDEFRITVVSGLAGNTNLHGGDGFNRLVVSGGDADYKATHQFGVLQYANITNTSYTSNYSEIAEITDNVVADSLTVWGTSAVDTFRLKNNSYQLEPTVSISYSQKQNLVINGSSTDFVTVDGNVTVPKTLTINNTAVTAENGGKVIAENLELAATQSVGSIGNRLQLSVNNIYLKSINGSTYINEQDSLNIKELSSSTVGVFDAMLGGDLLSSSDINYIGDLKVDSLRGNIILNNANSFAGNLSLKAAGDIDIKSLSSLNFYELSAQNLKLDSVGDMKAVGPITVSGATSLSTKANISFASSNHDFNEVRVIAANDVTLSDTNKLNLIGISAIGSVSVNAGGPVVIGASCAGGCIERTAVTAGGTLKIATADDIQMANNTVAESVSGNVIFTGKNIALSTIKASSGEIKTAATGAITDNNDGEINIYAQRWIADAISGVGSGRADESTQNAIETDVGILSVRNAGKLFGNTTINIVNTGTLTIEQLRNNGDISIANLTGDIILDNTGKNPLELNKNEERLDGATNSKLSDSDGADLASNEIYNPATADARSQGGIINANTGDLGGTLSLVIPNGMVRALGKHNSDNPDIIANSATFDYPKGTRFSFGERSRKIVMNIPNVYNQTARTSSVIWYKGKRPNHIVDSSKALSDLDNMTNDQLIQIEGLNEIDPAIFTSVSNYIHDEVAILMPADQRFDDDEYAE